MGRTFDILGVDPDKQYRDLYVGWLGADHHVHTVADGETALQQAEHYFDLVLLGRELPDMTGREAVEAIHARDQNCHVVMVSSQAADFDIVEYPIDRYVQKPLDGSALDVIIQQYESQQRYQSALEEFFRLTSKLGALEAEYPRDELVEDERYRTLERRAEQMRAEVDEAIFEHETDWKFAFKTCARAADVDVVSR